VQFAKPMATGPALSTETHNDRAFAPFADVQYVKLYYLRPLTGVVVDFGTGIKKPSNRPRTPFRASLVSTPAAGCKER
jgi:hypothetical protein